jgi:hypothetical protein
VGGKPRIEVEVLHVKHGQGRKTNGLRGANHLGCLKPAFQAALTCVLIMLEVDGAAAAGRLMLGCLKNTERRWLR